VFIKVGITDYGIGNLFSVDDTIKGLMCNCFVSSDPEVPMNADRIIFSGVGSFSDGMRRIKEFCKYIDITEDEFHETIDSFVNHDIFEKVNGVWKMKYERI